MGNFLCFVLIQKVYHFFNLVKFEHTIFAMPFALLGAVLGFQVEHNFEISVILKIILAMIFARNAAMAFNRYLDRDIDAINQRTSLRHIPAGLLTSNSVLFFVIINCLLFIACSYWINYTAFLLSPIALLVILSYSYTKRFTYLCHFVLGLALSLAPVGAFIAVTGTFNILPVLLGITILFWVSGFDIIYALQDETFDKANNLHSIPSKLGQDSALILSRLLHIFSASTLLYFTYLIYISFDSISILSIFALVFFALALVYQHWIVFRFGLARVNLAFFTLNGLASLVYCTLVIIDFYF